MEFNIEASLRVPQPNHAQARTHSGDGSDFGAKIGLQNDAVSTSSRETVAFSEHSTQSLLSQSASVVTVVSEQADMGESALIALYELGLRAGHHLSHVSHYFMADTVQSSLITSVGNGATTCSEREPEALTLSAMQASTAFGTLSLSATPLSASCPDTEASSILREWAGYLGSQWPERRWQLLKRPDGVELLVRDYHLSHEEQADLAAELRARIPSSSQQPERIWLNGQVIWQTESVMTHSRTGGRHGD
ncbi:MAG: hypothetical protein AABY68_05640 [Pseudomonadota bacterium]